MRLVRLGIVFVMLGLAAVPPASDAQPIGTRIFGKVLDPEGEPIAGATVKIALDDTDVYQRRLAAQDAEVETDKKGRYRVVFMQAARYFVFTIEKEGYKTIVERAHFGLSRDELNEPLHKDFVLEPGSDAPAGGVGGSAGAGLYNQAVEALQRKDPEAAKGLLEQALDADPELLPARRALAAVHLELGEFDAAADAAEAAIELDPESPELHGILYRALLGTGEAEEARYALDALIDLDPGPETQKLLLSAGIAAFNAGEHRYAKERLQDVLELDPERHEARRILARAHLELGEFQAAASTAEAALEADDLDRDMHLVRVKAYEGLGNDAAAAEARAELAALGSG